MKRNFSNFFGYTIANWSRCEIPDKAPDYISFTGSAYWDFGNKVRRCSDHWGRLRTSIWFLDCEKKNSFLCGECYYSEFRQLNQEILESLRNQSFRSDDDIIDELATNLPENPINFSVL